MFLGQQSNERADVYSWVGPAAHTTLAMSRVYGLASALKTLNSQL
jgi:hypothetical protein